MGFCPHCGEVPPPGSVLCSGCGRELVPAELDPLLGKDVGNYRITARLGVGGMGCVYSGVERNIDKKVAIKIVHPHLTNIAELPTLLAEAKAVNAIGDRGIVDVHGFGALPDGRQYLVMELLEGESLEARLKREGRRPLAELVTIGEGILSALEAAHAAGFVHRDIKPANVFWVRPARGEPFIKLLDFGLAHRARTATTAALGTPGYVAPEQALPGAKVGPAADLYSTGCVLFEAALGRMPFNDPDPMRVLELHTLADRPAVRRGRPDLPAAFETWIHQMMAVDAARRPANAGVARATLSALRPKKRSRATRVAVAAVLVAAAATTGLLLKPTPMSPSIPADPLWEAVHREATGIRQALDADELQAAYARLQAAERSFPHRKEWPALRSAARAALQLKVTQALAEDRLADAESWAALDPPPADDPLQRELQRAAQAHKTGMVRAGAAFIDVYEYPNRAGTKPTTSIDWKDAAKLCQTAGKRLCTEEEWQRACTSGQPRAYPYGDRLELQRCHHKGKLKTALPAGALPGCVTPEGVHDLSGNVAEWTSTPVREDAPQRIIRGGSFGQSDIQLTCAARDYYLPGLGGAKHIGFRCCL